MLTGSARKGSNRSRACPQGSVHAGAWHDAQAIITRELHPWNKPRPISLIVAFGLSNGCLPTSCIEREQTTNLVDMEKVALHRDEDDLPINASYSMIGGLGVDILFANAGPRIFSLGRAGAERLSGHGCSRLSALKEHGFRTRGGLIDRFHLLQNRSLATSILPLKFY